MLNPNVNRDWLSDSDRELIALYQRLDETDREPIGDVKVAYGDFEMLLAVLKERIKMIGVPTLGPNGYL